MWDIKLTLADAGRSVEVIRRKGVGDLIYGDRDGLTLGGGHTAICRPGVIEMDA